MSASPSPSSSPRIATWRKTRPRWCSSITMRLPAVADCVAALEPGAPTRPFRLAAQSVRAVRFQLRRRAMPPSPRAAHVFSETLSQHRGVAHSIEARGVVANYDELDDKLTVWSSTQTPARRQALSARSSCASTKTGCAWSRPMSAAASAPSSSSIPRKSSITLAALLLKRPVKWIEDRREHFVSTTQERDQIWTMQIALDAQGRILGLRGELIHDHGAWTARGVNVPYGVGGGAHARLCRAGAETRHQAGAHQQDAGHADPRRRPAAGRVRDGAAARQGGARTEDRPRGAAPPQSRARRQDALRHADEDARRHAGRARQRRLSAHARPRRSNTRAGTISPRARRRRASRAATSASASPITSKARAADRSNP